MLVPQYSLVRGGGGGGGAATGLAGTAVLVGGGTAAKYRRVLGGEAGALEAVVPVAEAVRVAIAVGVLPQHWGGGDWLVLINLSQVIC